MKKLFLLLIIIIILTGCSDPTSERSFDPIIDDNGNIIPVHEIVGTWLRDDDKAFDFYTNGEFLYYEYSTDLIFDEGIYNIDNNVIHLEADSGAIQDYIFLIMQDEPAEGVTTLRWATVGSPELTVDWLKVVE